MESRPRASDIAAFRWLPHRSSGDVLGQASSRAAAPAAEGPDRAPTPRGAVCRDPRPGGLHFPAASAPPLGRGRTGEAPLRSRRARSPRGCRPGTTSPSRQRAAVPEQDRRCGAAVHAGTSSPRGRRPRLRAARASGGALTLRVCLVACLRCSRSACPSLAGKMAAVRRARSYSRCVVRFSDRELC